MDNREGKLDDWRTASAGSAMNCRCSVRPTKQPVTMRQINKTALGVSLIVTFCLFLLQFELREMRGGWTFLDVSLGRGRFMPRLSSAVRSELKLQLQRKLNRAWTTNLIQRIESATGILCARQGEPGQAGDVVTQRDRSDIVLFGRSRWRICACISATSATVAVRPVPIAHTGS